MNKLQIIHLEDNPRDAMLVESMLKSAEIPCELHVVHSRDAFEHELQRQQLDLILSDFSMPAFNGLAALQIARVVRPDVPFLFVSGAIGEEAAIESLKNGASDYLIKDRLARLPTAVTRAINAARERQKLREAEDALREREAMFSSFMNFNPAVAFLKDAEGRLLYVNEPLERFFGWKEREWLGQTEDNFLPPECVRQLRQNDALVLATGRPLQTIENVVGPDGVPRQWFVCKFPLERRGEKLLGGLAIDVTEQKQLEEKFLRTQRLESLGTLASGIAHDLNNVLLPVLLGMEVLKGKYTEAEDQTILSMLESSVARGAAMVKQVLTFARGTEGEKLLLNPAHILRDVAQIAQRTMPAGITVQCSAPKDLWPVEGDPTQLHQVILNLAVNARDAMPGGGILSLRASNVEAADTGSGIPSEVRDKIFEPFFTTKEAGKGTGLGLATSLGIVQSHGGFIDFETHIGQGTVFRIYLPANPAGKPQVLELRDHISPQGGAEVVLVVDDEAGPREVTKFVLGMHAYQVLTAGNGAEALSVFRRFRDKIRAVVLDRDMPLMKGPETARAIRELNRDIKIIGMTGQPTDAAVAEFKQSGADVVLAKPFTAAQILETLNSLLRAPTQN